MVLLRARQAVAAAAAAAASVVGGLGACTDLLDMPAPALLCSDGTCVDSSSPIPTDDAPAPPTDQAPPPDEATTMDGGGIVLDAGLWDDARAPTPIRCGDGTSGPFTECNPPQVCCRTDSSGVVRYTCESVASCPRDPTMTPPATYPIECTGPVNCNAGYVCCHFHRATSCVVEYWPDGAPGVCLDDNHYGDVVCDPDASTCPTGSCTHLLTDIGYLACWTPP